MLTAGEPQLCRVRYTDGEMEFVGCDSGSRQMFKAQTLQTLRWRLGQASTGLDCEDLQERQ